MRPFAGPGASRTRDADGLITPHREVGEGQEAATAIPTPVDCTEENGLATQPSVADTTSSGRLTRSHEFHRWKRPIATPIAQSATVAAMTSQPNTAPNSASTRIALR